MIKAMFSAASGMKAQETEVDVIANNIANVNTSGFKRSTTNFQDLLYVTQQIPGAAGTAGTSAPTGLQVGSGSRLVSTAKVFTPGNLEQTRRSLDIAIRGSGFFEIQDLDGNPIYTRDGNFQLDAQGNLVTAEGLRLNPGITVPQGASEVSVAADGTISALVAGNVQNLGQITLVNFVNPAGLSSEGSNLFRATDSSGSPTTATPGSEGTGTLLGGWLERSNVEVVNELVRLIVAQRAYEMNSRSIRVSDEMLSTTNQIVR